jgi:TPR repeat protein
VWISSCWYVLWLAAGLHPAGATLASAGDASELVRACDEGDAESCGRLAVNHLLGVNAERNPALAVHFFEKACFGLGDMLLKGDDVPADHGRAEAAFARACVGGYPFACVSWGKILEGMQSPRASAVYGLARRQFLNRCTEKQGNGCYNYGAMLEEGMGGPKDFEQAVEFYVRACEGKDAQGCRRLGTLYESGTGVSKDSVRARKFYSEACALGDDDACELVRSAPERD